MTDTTLEFEDEARIARSLLVAATRLAQRAQDADPAERLPLIDTAANVLEDATPRIERLLAIAARQHVELENLKHSS